MVPPEVASSLLTASLSTSSEQLAALCLLRFSPESLLRSVRRLMSKPWNRLRYKSIVSCRIPSEKYATIAPSSVSKSQPLRASAIMHFATWFWLDVTNNTCMWCSAISEETNFPTVCNCRRVSIYMFGGTELHVIKPINLWAALFKPRPYSWWTVLWLRPMRFWPQVQFLCSSAQDTGAGPTWEACF